MLEIKAYSHTNRYFATKLDWRDIFRAVHYFGYLGDSANIPWYYSRHKGVSCVTDLTLPMEKIIASMKSNTRNEIRRAVKEGCRFYIVNDVDEFIPYYNRFCESKGLDDYITRGRILKYKNVLITKVMVQGQVLAMHANVLDRLNKTAFLLFSCSNRLEEGADKKLIGWGNKFLHYMELDYLKREGFMNYDWSGICLDKEDSRYSIGQFKLSFGGKITNPLMLRTPLFVLLDLFRKVVVKFRRHA